MTIILVPIFRSITTPTPISYILLSKPDIPPTPHALPDPRNTTRHPLRIHLRRVDYNATEHYSFSMLTFFLEPFFFPFSYDPPPLFI